MSDRAANFPPVTPINKPSQVQKGFFPFSAFSSDDPNVTNPPTLALASPWILGGTGTKLATSITGTAASLASSNPVLLAGQIGYETDTKYFKIGDGSTAYNSLMYQVQRTLEAAYTPTFGAGYGTCTNVSFSHYRLGNRRFVRGTFTTGSTIAGASTISLPGSDTIDTGLVTATEIVGEMNGYWSGAYVSPIYVIFVSGTNNSVSISSLKGGASWSTAALVNALFGNSVGVSIKFNYPINGANV